MKTLSKEHRTRTNYSDTAESGEYLFDPLSCFGNQDDFLQ